MSVSSEFEALSLSSTDLGAAGESHPMAVLHGDDRTPLLSDQRIEHHQEEEQQPSHVERDDQESEKGESLRQSPAKFWAVIISYVCILFLFACNGTVITTIYGKVAEDLHAYATAATWLNASYMVSPLTARDTRIADNTIDCFFVYESSYRQIGHHLPSNESISRLYGPLYARRGNDGPRALFEHVPSWESRYGMRSSWSLDFRSGPARPDRTCQAERPTGGHHERRHHLRK
jgi:hypothetical protein